MKFNTKALHWGYDPQDNNGCLAVPIYLTSSYQFESIEEAEELNSGKKFGHIYSRISNPTLDVLEKRVAALEGGVAAVACASGHAAQFLVINTLTKHGENIISSPYLYGGTYHQFKEQLPRMGIEVKFVNPYDFEKMEKLIDEKTRMIYVESLGNPELNAVNIKELSKIAQKYCLPLVVDNTLGCCGFVCKPIREGADIVLASLTKWGGGHGTCLGGIVIDSGNFDWSSGRFDDFTRPDPAYKNLSFWDEYGCESDGSKRIGLPFYKNAALAIKMRLDKLRDWGPTLSPFNAFVILQGIETLGLRVKQANENALVIAEWLNNNQNVKSVRYPGLKSDKYHKEAKSLLQHGYGSIVTFEPRGGYEHAKEIVRKVKLFIHAANIGDAKSLILHPASTTHHQLTTQQKEEAGVTESMIRLSIGIEDCGDLINDLSQALEGKEESRD